MPGLVIDASITIAGIMPEEDSVAARAALEQIADEGALVPGIWRIEIANALLIAERRKRIDLGRREEALARIAALPIEADLETWERAWPDIMPLASRFQLTAYDAAYLELAHRARLPLASLDDELRAAAKQFGVSLVTG